MTINQFKYNKIPKDNNSNINNLHNSNNLSSSKGNFSAAESRIRDADIAAEAGNLIRVQILQQAATSVLAQANQAPQLALTLLR